MNRRQPHLEVLVCALLLAALVVQPAAGDGKGKGPGQGQGHGQAQAQGHAQVPAHAQGQPGGPPAATGPSSVEAQESPAAQQPRSAASAGQGTPAAGAMQPGAAAKDSAKSEPPTSRGGPDSNGNGKLGAPGPPAGATAGPAEHANAGGNANGKSAKRGSARGAGARASANAGKPAAGESSRRGTDAGVTAAPSATDAPVSAGPGAPPQTGSIGLPAAPAAPDAQQPASGSLPARPATRRGTPRDNNAVRGPATTLVAPAAPGTASGATATGAPAVRSALEVPLATPASEAITRVRPGGPTVSGGARPTAGEDVDALQGVADSGASDASVGEVLVEWAKYALGLLGLLVLALGAYTVLATGRARRLERQRTRLMADIGLLQAALLPAVPARLGALLTTVAYRPADGPAAGGDFYDAFPLSDGRVGLLLGDVSGHGRQALAKTTLVRFTVRAHLDAGLSPREALAITGRTLDGRLSDDFATVIAAVHDPVRGTLTYASAGHPPPIVVGPPRHRPVTSSSAPPIGVGFPTGQRQTVLPMPEGTSVMIYSDGLLEARLDGVPLGPERLAEWLEELGPDATAKAVLDRVVTRADRVPDDLAAVVLHAAPGATAPAARIEQLKLDVLDTDGPDLEGFLRGAGVAEADRLIAGRRVAELLAKTSGVIVEVRAGEHPIVSVTPLGDESGLAARQRARTF